MMTMIVACQVDVTTRRVTTLLEACKTWDLGLDAQMYDEATKKRRKT
jgi:hypothetical protein